MPPENPTIRRRLWDAIKKRGGKITVGIAILGAGAWGSHKAAQHPQKIPDWVPGKRTVVKTGQKVDKGWRLVKRTGRAAGKPLKHPFKSAAAGLVSAYAVEGFLRRRRRQGEAASKLENYIVVFAGAMGVYNPIVVGIPAALSIKEVRSFISMPVTWRRKRLKKQELAQASTDIREQITIVEEKIRDLTSANAAGDVISGYWGELNHLRQALEGLESTGTASVPQASEQAA